MKLVSIFLLLSCPFFSTGQPVDKFVPVNVTVNTGPVSNKYILMTPMAQGMAPYPSNLIILDSLGKPVYRQIFDQGHTSPPYPVVNVLDFKTNYDGSLSFASNYNGVMRSYDMDSTFTYTDSISCSVFYTDAHDYFLAPNGHRFTVCIENRSQDLSSINTSDGTPGNVSGTITGNVIQEIDQNGVVVNEWKTIDHYSITDTYSYYFTNPTLLDHAHINSFEIDTDSNYIISSRHLDEICKVDRLTGAFIWRFGGKNNQFTLAGGDTTWFVAQHDARRHSNGDLSLFDNSSFGTSQIARGVRYQLDTINMVATKVWERQIDSLIKSNFIGNCQFLDNTNVLINWGGAFPQSETIFAQEFDVSGQSVLDIDLPDQFISYRVVKADLEFELKRPEIMCDTALDVLYATGGTQFYWNTGDIGQTLSVTDTGIYQVWVPYGNGYMSSEEWFVSDVGNPCAVTGVKEIKLEPIVVYPVPVKDVLYVQLRDRERIGDQIRVFDISGKEVLSKNISDETEQLDFGSLNSGVYLVVTNELTYKVVKQ